MALLRWGWRVSNPNGVQPPKKKGYYCVSCVHERERERERVEDVVIVGAGIGGLATSLALHRLGVRSLVLEQSKSLRLEGTAIGIWENAWRALDILGVADELRNKSTKLTQFEIYSKNGNLIKTAAMKTANRDIELRGVERKLLLQTLAEAIPCDALRYNSKVVHVSQGSQGSHCKIDLADGSTIYAKALVGCDGVRSVIAKSMDFSEPRYTGYYGIRGVAFFSEGHCFKPVFKQIVGQGVRVGFLPMSPNRLYWFLTFNSPLGPKISDPDAIIKEVLHCLKGWDTDIIEVIQRSLPETISRSAIRDRWLWPLAGPKPFKGCVALAGDALHPITPNLGQGGCLALEDAVVLARKLGKAFERPPEGSVSETQAIKAALESYAKERWPRIFCLSVQSFVIGAIMQIDIETLCSMRDAVLPLVARPEAFLGHTQYDCGPLLL